MPGDPALYRPPRQSANVVNRPTPRSAQTAAAGTDLPQATRTPPQTTVILPTVTQHLPLHRLLARGLEIPDGPLGQECKSYSERRPQLVSSNGHEWDGNITKLHWCPAMRPELTVSDYEAEELYDVLDITVVFHEEHDSCGKVLASQIYTVAVHLQNAQSSPLHHTTPARYTQKNYSYRSSGRFNYQRSEEYGEGSVKIIPQLPKRIKEINEAQAIEWKYGFTLYEVKALQRRLPMSQVTPLRLETTPTTQDQFDSVSDQEIQDMFIHQVPVEFRHMMDTDTLRAGLLLAIPDELKCATTGHLLEDGVILVGSPHHRNIVNRQSMMDHIKALQDRDWYHKLHFQDRTDPGQPFNPITNPLDPFLQTHPIVPYVPVPQLKTIVEKYVDLYMSGMRDKLDWRAKEKSYQEKVKDLQEQVKDLREQLSQSAQDTPKHGTMVCSAVKETLARMDGLVERGGTLGRRNSFH